MYDLGILPPDDIQQISHGNEADDDEEDQQVGIREGGDKLRDRIVGYHLRQQFRLMCPAECHLIACHLHPHRVDTVVGHDADIGHHQMVVTIHGEGIDGHHTHRLFWLRTHQVKGIGLHHEVEVLRVMMLAGKENRILSARHVGRVQHLLGA